MYFVVVTFFFFVPTPSYKVQDNHSNPESLTVCQRRVANVYPSSARPATQHEGPTGSEMTDNEVDLEHCIIHKFILINTFYYHFFWSFPSPLPKMPDIVCLLCCSEICFFSDPSCSPVLQKYYQYTSTPYYHDEQQSDRLFRVACCILYILILLLLRGGIIIYLLAYTCLCIYLRSINQSNRVTICTSAVTLTGLRDAELDQRGPFLPLCIAYCVMVSLFMSTSSYVCIHACMSFVFV